MSTCRTCAHYRSAPLMPFACDSDNRAVTRWLTITPLYRQGDGRRLPPTDAAPCPGYAPKEVK